MELLEYTVSSGAQVRGRNYSFFFFGSLGKQVQLAIPMG
jgi:hypothetical protein